MLGGMESAQFLERYWQKQPLLIRNAIPQAPVRLSAEELAGLACEPDVESRLVSGDSAAEQWSVRHGPFTEADFHSLPERDWTLLVQDVEKHIPAMARLLEAFRFVPDWRIDDLMISYAAPGGTVGPHMDRYDVFLLQAEGHRRWRVQFPGPVDETLREAPELRLLETFEPTHDWILGPGDMLYLPPGVPHYGIAEDPGLMYSVGFRAPAVWELVAGWMDDCLSRIDDELRYQDPDLRPQSNPGEISPAALDRMRGLIRNHLLADDATLDRFLGRLLTEPKPTFRDVGKSSVQSSPSLERRLRAGAILAVNPAVPVALIRYAEERGFLYAAGRELPLDPDIYDLGEVLSRTRRLALTDLDRTDSGRERRLATLLEWLSLGILLFEDELY